MKHKLIQSTLCAFTAVALSSCGNKADDKEGGDAAPGSASLGAGTEGGVVLVTDLPDELIEGTPKPIKLAVPHDTPKAAPEFKVPEGTVLLSGGKPVTSSDDMPIIGTLDLITDGDKDAAEGYYVELLSDLQWVQIDLGEEKEIYAIWVWHFHSQERAYHDVIVQISNDPEFEEGVTTVYNNDFDNSAGMGKGAFSPYAETRYGLLVDGKGTEGRYVRLYSDGNTSTDMNHYIEVEVWGK
ncbi:MAG: hypothetical protein R3242_10105 [Akkermansiaceae bacterium]|nr:hypothetical protein [Akkermansiaceae bacterium]